MSVFVGYFVGWILVLVILRYIYKRNQRPQKEYFDVFKDKEAYDKLLEETDDFEVLRKALLRRAMNCVKHVWEVSEKKNSLAQLVKVGAINDEMFNAMKKSEANLTIEIFDVQAEAEYLKENWGKTIINEGAQLAMQEKRFKAMLKEKKKKEKAEKRKQAEEEKEKEREKEELARLQARAEKARKELMES